MKQCGVAVLGYRSQPDKIQDFLKVFISADGPEKKVNHMPMHWEII